MQESGIIIGGGIAGLTAALAMRQLDIPADVYESAPNIMPVGSGIWMAPNAMQVFERLGIAEQINGAGVPLNKIAITDGCMRTLMQSDQSVIKAKFGHTTTAILRAKLQDILLSSIASDTVHLCKTVNSISEEADRVTVSFTDGSMVVAPFVIAADGIHSVARKQLFPNARLSPVRHIVWRGLSPISLRPEYKTAIMESWHGGVRFGFSEVADGLVDWFAVEPATAATDSREGLLRRLLDAFDAFAYPVKEILAQASEAKIIRNEIRDLEPMKTWSRGRVCLIGDAAHASTPYMGQGGCEAVEDAYVVAQCLATQETPQEAYKAMLQIRRKKAELIVRTSRMIGWTGSLRDMGASLRNFAIRATPQAIIEGQFFRVYTLNY